MGWTPERVRALRLARRQNQEDFAAAAGVDRVTVSRWENGRTPVSELSASRLDALDRGPRDQSRDYERGVLYACEAMSATIAQLLREAREADELRIRQTAKAMLAGTLPATAPSRQETPPVNRRTPSRSRTARDE